MLYPGALGAVRAAQNALRAELFCEVAASRAAGACSALSNPFLETWGECGYLTGVFTESQNGSG